MSVTAKIAVSLLLPAIPDGRDECVRRLIEVLRGKDGIEDVHVPGKGGATESEFCIHYDPARVSLPKVRELAKQAGAELDGRFGHVLVTLPAMHPREARALESRVQRISGVLEAGVSPAGALRIEFDRQEADYSALRAILGKLGSDAANQLRAPESRVHDHDHDDGAEPPDHDHAGPLGERAELAFAILSGALLLIGWLLSFTSTSAWIPSGLFVAASLCGGLFTFREAIASIRAGRFEIDSLMLLAAIGTAAIGKWLEGALLLFLFSLGHALEHYAMGRAKRAIEALAELAPPTALVRRGGELREVSVEELERGDIVIVKPNERVPSDGFIVKGESSVNQAPITGESIPVDKEAVDDPTKAAKEPDRLEPRYRVFAGTINGGGALEIHVTRAASDSTLARVVRLISEAETQKSPTQRFTDVFERYFVPAAISLAGVLLFSWTVIDEPFSASFYRAMAVLVAASPCALAIATPSAVLSGVARAARGGVLIKGGAPLENLGRLASIAFDKTGTLTEGKPRLTDVETFEGNDEKELLRVAIAVEELSDHPLAAAVVRGARERLKETSTLQATDVRAITGRGVKAAVDGVPVFIGKESLFDEIRGAVLTPDLRARIADLRSRGRTTIIVRRGDSYLGVLGLMDTPREAAREVVARLRELGIERTIMLSGDSQEVADAVARETGIQEALGDLMPDDKVEQINKLSVERGVAMVGDGVNDAPAMAAATVGIAMGAAGSDVALETADVALMADDLRHLPFAVGLSRKTTSIIRQNLWFSLGMVAFLVPATILGLEMGAAVMFHEGSTLLVVFNALRLLAYRDR